MSSTDASAVIAGEAGVSILEVVIALAILLTVLVSVSSLVTSAFSVGGNERDEQAATEIATSVLDTQVETGATALLGEIGDTAMPSVASGGQTYLLEQEVAPYQPGNSACVSPTTNAEAMLKVTVWATWSDEPSGTTWWLPGPSLTSHLVEETTLLALPGTAIDPAKGSILVSVDGAAGTGTRDVSVTATPPSGTALTAVTTENGCALFANVATGTWTVQITKAGYIDDTVEALSPSKSVIVSAGQTATATFGYDLEATVTPQYAVTLAGSTPWLPTGLGALPLSFYTSNGVLTTVPYVTSSPGLVFPFSGSPSYDVVAGSCGAESAPDGSAVDGVGVTLTPGGQATPTIDLVPVQLTVDHGGAAVSGATVSAAVASGDTNCASGALAMPTLGLGSTCVPGVQCAVNVAFAGTGHPAAILVSTGTSTTITASLNPSTYGSPVAFAATVTRSGGFGTPTGTLSFTASGSAIPGCTSVAFSATTSTSATATCTDAALGVGAGQTVTATYNPGSGFTASNASLSQTVTAASTTTNVAINPNPGAFGTSVVLTATVTASSPSTATPTGSITFTSNGTAVTGCAGLVLVAGAAQCTVSGLAGGSYSVTAAYTASTGPTDFSSSTSPTVTQSVTAAATTTTLATSASPWTSGSSTPVTLTATVAASSGGPATGTVTFEDGGTALGAAVPLVGGGASFTTSSLAVGAHGLSAVYTPSNSNDFAASTGTLTEVVEPASTTPTIVSGLPEGVWVLTVTYVVSGVTYTNSSTTLTVTESGISVNGGAPVPPGTPILLTD